MSVNIMLNGKHLIRHKIVSGIYFPDDYHLSEVYFKSTMTTGSGGKSNWMRPDLDILYFWTKMTRQKTMFSIRQWTIPAENTHTHTQNPRRATRKWNTSVRLLPPPHLSSSMHSLFIAVSSNLNKICQLLWIDPFFYFVGDHLAEGLFFKPIALDWKKLNPENEPGVWFELQICTNFSPFYK